MYPGVHAARTPNKPAAIMAGSGDTLSYAELESGSARLARYLREAGLRRGDNIALLTDNNLTAFEVYWAALRAGLYITVVNWHLLVSEAAYIVSDCDATALVASANLGRLATEVRERSPAVRHALAFGGSLPGYLSYADELAGVSDEPMPDQPRGADMLYSSGTTGPPKGIKHTLPDRQVHEPGDRVTEMFHKMFGLGEDTVFLTPAPIYHSAPLRYAGAAQAYGGTVVLAERFDAEQALANLERFRATASLWVPTMFVRLLRLPDEVRSRYDVSSLRVAVHVAAPCPIDVKRAMIDWWGPVIYDQYGTTEAYGSTIINSEEWLRKPGSVGRDGYLGTARICGPDGEELPGGEIGTIFFEREQLPFEYHKDPEKTKAAQHPRHPNWTTVGDVGYLDEDRYLFLTDRASFTIISGGVKIYPREVEDCLALHPKVHDVAVFGVPDEEMGEVVKAVVQPARGAEPGPELERELIEYLRERIARYKCPRSVDFSDELPRTPTGKLVKRKVRDRYLDP